MLFQIEFLTHIIIDFLNGTASFRWNQKCERKFISVAITNSPVSKVRFNCKLTMCTSSSHHHNCSYQLKMLTHLLDGATITAILFFLHHIRICLIQFISIYLSIYLSIDLSIYLHSSMHLILFVSIYLSIYQSICLSVCLFLLFTCLGRNMSMFSFICKRKHLFFLKLTSHKTLKKKRQLFDWTVR